jgi:lysophospholipase L1-like esterase
VIGPPSISCPSDVTSDVDRAPSSISYSAPVVSGGLAPIATTCTIASGAVFPPGTSDILCTATDAEQRSAQCVFHVNVNVTSRLKVTKFMAFGDSLTWGEVAQAVSPGLHVYDPANSYPTFLQAMLKDAYSAQAADIIVWNEGAQGLSATKDEDRFVESLNARRPDAVLLLEGSNDVNSGTIPPSAIAQSLRANVSRAKRMGVATVFLATLPPEVSGRPRALNPDGIFDANYEIKDAAQREGAILVDLYEAMYPQRELLIGDDGLHATSAGYKFMASTFLAAIRANLQVTGGGTSAPSSFGPSRPLRGGSPFSPSRVRSAP